MSKQPSIVQLKNVLQNKGPQRLLQNVAAPTKALTDWLAELILLADIPFQNLVADTRLLPQNSLRFFYVDPSWLNALIDGALSIGNSTSIDTIFTSVMAESIRNQGVLTSKNLRSDKLGLTNNMLNASPVPDNLISGLMLRSDMISTWPSLKIIPTYLASQNISQVPLRYQTIGNDLILIIFPGVPQSITIQQPPHGLFFGVDDGKDAAHFNIYLRSVGTGSTATGVQLPGVSLSVPVTGTGSLFRAGDVKNVLDINTLKNNIQTTLANAGAFPKTGSLLTPAQFAMQILNTPEQAVYSNPLTETQNEQ